MLRANFFQIAIMGRTDGQTDGETDGVTALLDLLSPSATQVTKWSEIIVEPNFQTP